MAPLLAETLLVRGRLDEVEPWIVAGRDVTAADDIDAQVRWRYVLALLRSAEGSHDEAESLAHAAVQIVAPTEFVVLHASALFALAQVLRNAAFDDRARAVAREARRLAMKKGNVAGVRKIDRLLGA